jgi:NADPH-dependent 2,4-dienoyl-CoA reductase/sulfur reductase-like enzyme
MRLAIIGGDAAGMAAGAMVARRDPSVEIVAFERGPYTSYSACGIPYFLSEAVQDAGRLISRSPDEHRANGIDVRTRTEVTAVDLAARTLTACDLDGGGETVEGFDQLLLATGAHAVAPPVPGAEACEPIRTVDAAERLRDVLREGRGSAVVVGAGYIGLETAEALVQRGLKVTLVDRATQVMSTLDPEMAAHVQDAAEGEGIDVRLGAAVEEILLDADGMPNAVRIDGETVSADHVIVGAGARPTVGLAEGAGLTIGASGAVAVDDHQRCPGHDGVFAAGDCAESFHRLLQQPVNVQLGTHANKQGRVVAINATGGDASFPGVIGTAISRICRYEVARTGLSESEAAAAGIDVVAAEIKATTRAGYFPGTGPIWVKLVVAPGSGRILGGQIVGVQGAGKRIDTLAVCVWTGMTAEELSWLDLAYAPPFSGVFDPLLIAAHAATKLV